MIGGVPVQVFNNKGVCRIVQMLANACHDGLAGKQRQDKNGDDSTELDHDNSVFNVLDG